MFLLDAENAITYYEEPPAALLEGALTFATSRELTAFDLSMDRLVAIWNSFAGVAGPFGDLKPVRKFENRTKAIVRIWDAIQRLAGASTEDQPAPATPKAHKNAQAGAQAAKAAPTKPDATKKTTSAKNAPKARKAAKARESAGPRDGTKKSQVVSMLQRKGGATLAEIMEKMSWQKHTVRGMIAGSLKKAGYVIESFKPEGGERTYRINP